MSAELLHLQILADALAVEYVVALGHNGIFGRVVADAADGAFGCGLREGARLRLQDEIGMARHLTHSRDEREDVGVILCQLTY